MKVKEMEVEQRPREKALRYGLESLSDGSSTVVKS